VQKNGLNGLLSSLAGAKKQMQETVRFPAQGPSLREAIDHIKRLQGTGALTIHYADGKPNGLAEWKTSLKGGS